MIKQWTLDGAESWRPLDNRLAIAALAHVGRSGFADHLLAELEHAGRFEHCTVFGFDTQQRGRVSCSVVDAASRHQVATARRTSALFADRFAHLDVNGRYLGDGAHRAGIFATYFVAQDLPHSDYRDACYIRNGLVDRFSVVTVNPANRGAIALNLYRSARLGPMRTCDREQLLRCAPILALAGVRHAEMLRADPGNAVDMLLRIPGSTRLTARESELCTLLLEGATLNAAAERMEIKASTAITLKKRAFARLGVRSREDLLRLAARRPAGVLPLEDRHGPGFA
jgi:DNA-binding CsgD family transcriptional regulator